METIRNLKKVYNYSKKYGKYIILYLLGSIFLCVVGIATPILTSMQLVNLTNQIWEKALLATALVFGFEIFRNIINYVIRKFAQIFFRETVYSIQTNMAREILKIEVSSIDNHTTGVFTQRLSTDTNNLSSIFTRGGEFITNIVTDIGVFIAVLIISPLFFLYFVAVFMVLMYLHKKRIYEISKKDRIFRDQREKAAGLVTELVRGVRDIKMLNAEESFMKEVSSNIKELNSKGYDMSNVSRTYSLLIGTVKDINDALLALLVIYFISEGSLALSLGVVIFSYRMHIFNLVSSIGFLLDYIRDFNLSCERVFSIFESEEFKKEKFGTKHIEKVSGNFEFKNVSFGYDKNKVLNDINFKVNAHETVAFVGKSGAGKTTIFSLLCKLYNIEKGNIYIDGNDINDLDKESIRGNITIISQSPYIFNMSIKENLKLVKEDLTDEEMKKACKLACLDEFIEELPDKYDTVVGESGVTLSGGQRQRLAIARALVQKTKIILFDEATSALDNETQNKIQSAINNMKSEYTILIIAHRLSTVINSDRILLLDEGKIKDEGTHEELLKNSELYKKLYEAEMTE